MPRHAIIAAMILLSLTLLCQSAPVSAVTSMAMATPTFSTSLSSDKTLVSIDVQVGQNLTFLDRFFSLPQFTGKLSGPNATSITSMVQAAVASKASQANISDLTLAISSSRPTDGTTFQWFNVSLQFKIDGIRTPDNGNQRTDMSWKSFALPSNITIGGIEVNNVGPAYMSNATSYLAGLEAPSQATQSGTTSYRNLVNDRVVTAVGLPAAFAKIQLLNFTRLLPHMDSWTPGYNFATQSLTWSLNSIPILGLSVQQKNNEPQSTETVNSGLYYTIQAVASAPLRSFAQGDAIVVVFQDTSQTVMGAAIVSVLALGIVAYLGERRYLRGRDSRRSRR